MKAQLKWLFAAGCICMAFLACEQAATTTDGTGEGEAADSLVNENAEMTEAELIAEGARLVRMLDCDVCHSPKVMTDHGPEPDPARRLSGHPADIELPDIDKALVAPGQWALTNNEHFTAWVGPWGVSYAANLTPDDTGIGLWTFDQFEKAIREGKQKGMDGTRMLLPPMPWQAYKNTTDDELKAIFTYLKSIQPVANVVPQPVAPDQL